MAAFFLVAVSHLNDMLLQELVLHESLPWLSLRFVEYAIPIGFLLICISRIGVNLERKLAAFNVLRHHHSLHHEHPELILILIFFHNLVNLLQFIIQRGWRRNLHRKSHFRLLQALHLLPSLLPHALPNPIPPPAPLNHDHFLQPRRPNSVPLLVIKHVCASVFSQHQVVVNRNGVRGPRYVAEAWGLGLGAESVRRTGFKWYVEDAVLV